MADTKPLTIDEVKMFLREGTVIDSVVEVKHGRSILRAQLTGVRYDVSRGCAVLQFDAPEHLNPRVTKPRKPRTQIAEPAKSGQKK